MLVLMPTPERNAVQLLRNGMARITCYARSSSAASTPSPTVVVLLHDGCICISLPAPAQTAAVSASAHVACVSSSRPPLPATRHPSPLKGVDA